MLSKLSSTFAGNSSSKGPSSTDEELDKRIRKLISKYERVVPKKDVDAYNVDMYLGDEQHQVGTGIEYLFTLRDCIVVVKSENKNGPVIPVDSQLWKKAVQFLNAFDPVQMRYAGATWRSIIETVYESAITSTAAQDSAVVPVRTAILRLDPTSGTFTSTHLLFLRLCLDCGMLEEALPVLDNVIHSIPLATSHGFDGEFPCSDHQDSSGFITNGSGLTEKITVQQVQEYYLLGAIIFIGLRRWEDALLFLEFVITSPSQNTATGYMLEAYQKWILVACLARGHVPDLPKNANSQAIRIIKAVAKPYDALVKAFQDGDFQRLQAEVNVGLQVWDEHGNLGLALAMIEYLPRFYIINLQKRFAAVPMRNIAEWINQDPNRALELVQQLISTGALNAKMDMTGEPVLRFYTTRAKGPLAKSEGMLCAELVAQTERTNLLAEYARLADRKIMFTKDYIDAVRKKAQAAEASEAGGGFGNHPGFPGAFRTGDAMDTKWENNGGYQEVQDEDIMESY